MKRLTAFFVLFLTALCFALTASAADYAVNNVSMDAAAVTVNVTAQSDCALFVGLYDKDGRLLSVQTRSVAATTGTDISLSIPGGIPSGSSAKAFLTGADNKPLCKSNASGDASATDSDVYAILYADGTMVFQHGNTPQAGREVKDVYVVDMTGSYEYYEESGIPSTPWYDAKSSIKQVEFADVIQPKSTAYWFCGCSELKEIKEIKNLNTANVTDMSGMFAVTALTELDVSNFNTANVTNMRRMFAGCVSLTALDLSNFNTTNVIDMGLMFLHCFALETLNLTSFKTDNVTDMSFMFSNCQALKALNLTSFKTGNVTNMHSMFGSCQALQALDLSPFNTDNVTDMGFMFYYCTSLTALDLSLFNTANVTDMSGMFWGCSNLITTYVSRRFVTNQVTKSDDMFFACSALIGGNGTKYDRNHTDADYARIDGGPDNPGYFTAK